LHLYGYHRHLLSFPTRRSSDLTALDELLSGKSAHPGLAGLAERDRALMRRLVATVLRRLGTLRHLVGGFLDKGFPSDASGRGRRSEEHTSELQSLTNLVCRLLL